MSAAAADNLPEEFLLHFRSRRKGNWTHYVLVRKTVGSDGKNRLIRSPFTTVYVPPHPLEPIHMGAADHKYEWAIDLMNISFVGHTGTIVVASFLRNPTTVKIHGATPKTVPILYTPKYSELLGPRLRANFMPDASPGPWATSPAAITPTPLMIPSPTTGLASAPPPLSSIVNTIEHVQPPTPAAPLPVKVKKIKAPKPAVAATPAPPAGPRRGDLAPFVAKQLLALAQIRHDQCPIVAEEFSDGNTAAMPCGHLFAQIAIEESFKKEPNKCPACRAPGRPTYV